MSRLKLKGLGLTICITCATLAALELSVPARGQSMRSAQSSVQPTGSSSAENAQPPQGETQLPSDLSTPLEVDQSQSSEFFNSAEPPRTVNQALPPADANGTLVGPPAGNQVPEQATPDRLTLPLP